VIKGIDISRWQGSVDFDAVAASGRRFVIVKATEGQTGVDSQFKAHWAALRVREDRLLRGAYHFARWDTDGGGAVDAELEAISFCSLLTSVGGWMEGCLAPVLDFEWSSTGDVTWSSSRTESAIAWIARWVEIVEAELGRSPMIYTGRRTWAGRLGNTAAFAHLPLFQADYSRALDPMPWPRVSVHQYGVSDVGAVPGVLGRCDLDRIPDESTLAELARPQLYRPARASIMLELDLATMPAGVRSHDVAVLQGILLALGFGPAGLVGPDGRPDGKPGPATRAALVDFRVAERLGAGARVDGATWHRLLRSGA
jgi:GH25 family lysozyme M1 (1,4-beta-N-acetylmuramidase)